jgi:hypothetical protein
MLAMADFLDPGQFEDALFEGELPEDPLPEDPMPEDPMPELEPADGPLAEEPFQDWALFLSSEAHLSSDAYSAA